MFQVLDKFILDGKLQDDTNIGVPAGATVVIDDQLKAQYKGIAGITIWTPDYKDLRELDIELKIDSREVFPAGFPSEIFSVNPFRNVEDCTMKVDFPSLSKIEGRVTNHKTGGDPVQVRIILFVKL
jgi:hypothetical protein